MAREEVRRVLGDSACSMDDVGRMKYLECCIKESLRLYPPVPNFKRRVPQDIELGGYKVPAGASISIHVYALHRSERHFGPDPLAFRPQRFDADDSASRRHPFAFLPFSAGPRNCIGINYSPNSSMSFVYVLSVSFYRPTDGDAGNESGGVAAPATLPLCLRRRGSRAGQAVPGPRLETQTRHALAHYALLA